MNINYIIKNVKNNFKNILGTSGINKMDSNNNINNINMNMNMNKGINNTSNINGVINNGINRVSNTINNIIPNRRKYNNYGNSQGNFGNSMNGNMYNSNLKYNIISEESLREFFKGDVVILDVRAREEYMAVHLKNSINLPLEEITDNIQSIVPDKNKTILVYCFTGDRTKEAILKLNVMGYSNIYIWGNGGINTLKSKEFLEY